MRDRLLPPLAFAVMVILLGVNFVAVRVSNRELAPFWGSGLRFVIAAAILALVATTLRGATWPRGRALVGALVYGALGFGAVYALLYWGLLEAPSSLASVLFSTVPLMTVLGAAAIGQERLTLRAVFGALVAAAGAVIVFADQVGGDVSAGAVVAILLGAAAGAASGLVVRGFPKSHPVTTNAVAMAVGAAMLLAISWPAGDFYRMPREGATWLALAWLVTSSCIAFVIMVWLIGQWGASRVSYSTVLFPIVTTLVATWLTDEPVTWGLVAGGLVVIAGVWIGALRAGRPAAKPEAPTRA